MKLRATFLIAICLLVTGCPKDPVPPTPDADSGPEDPDAAMPATCASWCKHAATLSCPSAKPTPNGATCEQVCDNVQRSGFVTWDLKCRIGAKTCAAADACEKGR